MTDITELVLITKIKKQLENFDTVILKEDEALALVEALEKSEKTSEARREAIDRTHNMFVRERDRANAAEEELEKAQRANAAQDDHINQQQERIDQLEKGHQEAAKQINSWRRMAKQNIAEREKDIAELDAARQRIAELELHKAALLKFIRESCYVFDGYDADISDAYIDATSSNLMPKIEAEPCHHCSDGSYSGLPGGACEHCMGTGLDNPAAELESRTVTVKLPPKIERNDADGWFMYNCWRVGGGAAEWYNKALDDVGAELTAAGIKVEVE